MRRNGRFGAGTSLEEVKRRFDAWRREHRWPGRVPNSWCRRHPPVGEVADMSHAPARPRSAAVFVSIALLAAFAGAAPLAADAAEERPPEQSTLNPPHRTAHLIKGGTCGNGVRV